MLESNDIFLLKLILHIGEKRTGKLRYYFSSALTKKRGTHQGIAPLRLSCLFKLQLTPYFSFVPEFDECSSSPCLNGGTCTDGINNYTCACRSPFFGSQCQGATTKF